MVNQSEHYGIHVRQNGKMRYPPVVPKFNSHRREILRSWRHVWKAYDPDYLCWLRQLLWRVTQAAKHYATNRFFSCARRNC
jgi:hypothetical protein